jgi:hypothetical protein
VLSDTPRCTSLRTCMVPLLTFAAAHVAKLANTWCISAAQALQGAQTRPVQASSLWPSAMQANTPISSLQFGQTHECAVSRFVDACRTEIATSTCRCCRRGSTFQRGNACWDVWEPCCVGATLEAFLFPINEIDLTMVHD